MSSPPVTLQKALAAYGGEAFWRAARSIRATVSTSGLAFVLKWQKPFRRIGVECGVREPFTRLTPMDEAGNSGVLRNGDVFLENPSGSVIAHRRNARSFFPYGRRLFWWDSLDQTYFAGYALWNYLVFPALLLREDIRWEEPGPNRLLARFPGNIPTHSPVQEFLFDPVLGAPAAAQLHGRGHGGVGKGGKRGRRARRVERHPLPVAPASDPAKKRRVPRRRTRPHRSRSSTTGPYPPELSFVYRGLLHVRKAMHRRARLTGSPSLIPSSKA